MYTPRHRGKLPFQSPHSNESVYSNEDSESKPNGEATNNVPFTNPPYDASFHDLATPMEGVPSWETPQNKEFAKWELDGSRFQITRVVGEGSYGAVAEAEDQKLGRKVAIKRISSVMSHLIDARRIYREMYILRRLSHPRIVTLLDVLTPPSTLITQKISELYFVFDFSDTDLRKLIDSPQFLSLIHIQTILHQILDGISYLHAARVIHRDIKPANILINKDVSIKICDFGLSRVVPLSRTSSKNLIPNSGRKSRKSRKKRKRGEEEESSHDTKTTTSSHLNSNFGNGDMTKKTKDFSNTPLLSISSECPMIMEEESPHSSFLPSPAILTNLDHDEKEPILGTFGSPDIVQSPNKKKKKKRVGSKDEDSNLGGKKSPPHLSHLTRDGMLRRSISLTLDEIGGSGGIGGEGGENDDDVIHDFPTNDSFHDAFNPPPTFDQDQISNSNSNSNQAFQLPPPSSSSTSTSSTTSSQLHQSSSKTFNLDDDNKKEEEEDDNRSNRSDTPSSKPSSTTSITTPDHFTEQGRNSKMKNTQLTKHVVTRWYRAPEIVLVQDYSFEVDLWSVGCIFGELLGMMEENIQDYHDRDPLFPGKASGPFSKPDASTGDSTASSDGYLSAVQDYDQLETIFSILGPPDESELGFIGDEVAMGKVREASKVPLETSLDDKFPGAGLEGIDLLRRFVSFSPSQRITAKQAMEHPFFSDMEDPPGGCDQELEDGEAGNDQNEEQEIPTIRAPDEEEEFALNSQNLTQHMLLEVEKFSLQRGENSVKEEEG